MRKTLLCIIVLILAVALTTVPAVSGAFLRSSISPTIDGFTPRVSSYTHPSNSYITYPIIIIPYTYPFNDFTPGGFPFDNPFNGYTPGPGITPYTYPFNGYAPSESPFNNPFL